MDSRSRRVVLGLVLASCAARTSRAPSAPAAVVVARHGHVEAVADVPATDERKPPGVVGAVVVGLLLIDLLFHNDTVVHGHGSALYGAAATAEHSADGEAPQLHRVEVFVRFDDGGTLMLTYAAPAPFRLGDRVVLTSQGLDRG
jgi:outer membrane lipoprotein SlyB